MNAPVSICLNVEPFDDAVSALALALPKPTLRILAAAGLRRTEDFYVFGSSVTVENEIIVDLCPSPALLALVASLQAPPLLAGPS